MRSGIKYIGKISSSISRLLKSHEVYKIRSVSKFGETSKRILFRAFSITLKLFYYTIKRLNTRKLSSRMRTACLLIVSHSIPCISEGVCNPPDADSRCRQTLGCRPCPGGRPPPEMQTLSRGRPPGGRPPWMQTPRCRPHLEADPPSQMTHASKNITLLRLRAVMTVVFSEM